MQVKPLSIPREQWACRWVEVSGRRRLHRVARLDVSLDAFLEWPVSKGRTLCEIEGTLEMPGVASRIGAERCPACCELAGVPRGNGAPMNEGLDA